MKRFDFTPKAQYRKIIEEMRRECYLQEKEIERLKRELREERTRHLDIEDNLSSQNAKLVEMISKLQDETEIERVEITNI
jgi:hypothetical protein